MNQFSLSYGSFSFAVLHPFALRLSFVPPVFYRPCLSAIPTLVLFPLLKMILTLLLSTLSAVSNLSIEFLKTFPVTCWSLDSLSSEYLSIEFLKKHFQWPVACFCSLRECIRRGVIRALRHIWILLLHKVTCISPSNLIAFLSLYPIPCS